ncbi:MAG: FAD-dependent oxidoreductase, partial [Armatimonadota bacterium]
MTRYDADVIVVGAGPAGATAARLLAAWGINVLLIEKFR